MVKLRGEYVNNEDSNDKFEIIHHTPKTIGLGKYSKDRCAY